MNKIAPDLLAVLETSHAGTVPIAESVTVRVTGAIVDDGSHGPMSATDWARRAALAGITLD